MTDKDDSTPETAPTRRQGRLQTWRARWFGERDEVADQLADIARQGSGMARLAHVCASLMLVLFSAGSLVALGGGGAAECPGRRTTGACGSPGGD